MIKTKLSVAQMHCFCIPVIQRGPLAGVLRLSIALGAMLFSQCGVNGAEVPALADRVLAAALANETRLRSGEGRGVYRAFDANDELTRHIKFLVRFSDPKYYVELQHLPTKTSPNTDLKVRAFSDGKAVFATRFSSKILSSGCETWVYDANTPFALISVGMQINPSEGVRYFDPRYLLEKHEVRFEELPNGTHEGKFQLSDKVIATIVIDPDIGHNVLSVEARGKDQPMTTTYDRTELSWSKTNGIWYTNTIKKELFRHGKLVDKTELTFARFQVVLDVPATYFSMKALDICEKSRIIDSRPGANPKFYDFEGPGVTDENPEVFLAGLPHGDTATVDLEGETLVGISNRRALLIVLNIAVVIIMAFLVLLKRRATR